MPGGYITDAELINVSIPYDELVESFHQAMESFGRMQSIIVESTHQMNNLHFIDGTFIDDDPYPKRDKEGTYWYDSVTRHTDGGPCTVCSTETVRFDIHLNAHLCQNVDCILSLD